MIALLRVSLFLIAFIAGRGLQAFAGEKPVSRISFGSCAKQDKPQPIWDAVVETMPELFLFLGDNIYADTQDMDLMRAKYKMLGDQLGFRSDCMFISTADPASVVAFFGELSCSEINVVGRRALVRGEGGSPSRIALAGH